ncbi:LysR family transcriptional regulator [Pseudorhodoferax soli]|uniref:LysR family transcriptional regulator n=1 Tax=Pseudorhodoferax soli TaxID=545864 RepID=A0A368X988_9BURK|nr:LysR family transcriptional regulator [Pseudorhodoferax soli]RCW64510.1 LysR family transcriptional regulator [Pseudorhodoferax soli]
MNPALLDLHLLRAFVAVARQGSVSRAATQLHRTQPALSLQLKKLAEASGLELFQRGAHGMVLSADGAALLQLAERTLAAADDFARGVERLHGSARGLLRIGTILDPSFLRLGDWLGALVRSAPQIATELRHGISGSVMAQLQQGQLDVCFYLSPSLAATEALQPALAGRTLTRFDYRVVAPAGWGPQVAGRDWEALATLPWLETPPESAHHRLLQGVFGPRGLAPRRAALVDQEASMLDLIKSGVGLSLVRDAIAMRESQQHGLAVADQVRIGCELQFVCLAGRREDAVVQAAWRALEQVWG